MRRALERIMSAGWKKAAIDLDHLTRLVRRYSVEKQQVPRDLADLVTGNYLKTLPVPPNGRKLVVDRTKVEVRLE